MVPNLWHIEIGNALLVAERRKVISAEEKSEALRHLGRLPITVDGETAAGLARSARAGGTTPPSSL
jgi:hypothetical protein